MTINNVTAQFEVDVEGPPAAPRQQQEAATKPVQQAKQIGSILTQRRSRFDRGRPDRRGTRQPGPLRHRGKSVAAAAAIGHDSDPGTADRRDPRQHLQPARAGQAPAVRPEDEEQQQAIADARADRHLRRRAIRRRRPHPRLAAGRRTLRQLRHRHRHRGGSVRQGRSRPRK